MKRTIRFIINPISGVGKKNLLPSLIQAELDHSKFDYDIIYTEYRGHAHEIAKNLVEEKIDIICVAGGDGSVNEVGSALVNSQSVFAILPAGSGNGVSLHLGLPLNLKKAIHRINDYNVIQMDTVTLNDKPAIGVSGFGFDAQVAKKFDGYHKRGLASYAKLVLKEWRTYKGIDITFNNKTYKSLLFCCIANTSQFGNNFYVSPESDVTDGEVELVIVKLPRTLSLLNILIASIRKKVHLSKYVEIIKVKSAEIEVENLLGHIDGDPVEYEDSKIKIQCKPKSLSVIV